MRSETFLNPSQETGGEAVQKKNPRTTVLGRRASKWMRSSSWILEAGRAMILILWQ
jgi:hypothetical protein